MPIYNAAYATPHVDVLAGDTVTWQNDSVRAHTVNADDGTGLAAAADVAARSVTGSNARDVCVLLPAASVDARRHRRAPRPARRAEGPGRRRAAVRALRPCGAAGGQHGLDRGRRGRGGDREGRRPRDFTAIVKPKATATYTAVAAGESAPPVQVLVLDRKVSATRAYRGGKVHGRRAGDAGLGGRDRRAPAASLKEHFGWWPVQRSSSTRTRARALLASARAQGRRPRAADRLRRRDRARPQRHVPPTLERHAQGPRRRRRARSAGSPPPSSTPTSSCSTPTTEHVAALREPGLVYEQEGAERTAVLDAVTSRRRARGRVRLRARRGQVAAAPRGAGAAGRARRDRRVRLDRQRADPGPHGGDRRRRQPARVHRRVGRLERRAGAAGARLARRLHGRRARRHGVRARARAGGGARAGRARAGHRQRARDDLVQAADQHAPSPDSRRSQGCATAAWPSRGRDAVFALWAEGVAVADAQGLALESIHASTRTASTTAALARMMERRATCARRCCRTSTRAARPRSTSSTAASPSAGASSASPRRATTRVVELVHSMERGERSPEPRWLRYVSEAQTTSATEI